MQNKRLNIEPLTVPTGSVANIFNCALGSLSGPVGMAATQPYVVLEAIRAINTTASAITLTLYKGATGASAAGTQFAFPGISIPANSYLDFYQDTRFDSSDFLTGLASATGIVLNMSGEIGFS
jgi:hypothetical protein